jgi:hypothetical protein
MPHIFLNTSNFNGDNRFYTNSAILHTTHYKPKVLIIGTYNDGNHQNNLADFFYGRNYFWPVMYNLANNLALGNINQLTSSRKRSLIAGAPNPTLNQILELCKQFELAFADLVQDVLVPLGNHADKYVNNAVRNGQAIDNVAPIVEFLNKNPTNEFVYCTTKFSQLHHLEILWNQIIENVELSKRSLFFLENIILNLKTFLSNNDSKSLNNDTPIFDEDKLNNMFINKLNSNENFTELYNIYKNINDKSSIIYKCIDKFIGENKHNKNIIKFLIEIKDGNLIYSILEKMIENIEDIMLDIPNSHEKLLYLIDNINYTNNKKTEFINILKNLDYNNSEDNSEEEED